MEVTPDSTQLYVTGFLDGVGQVHVVARTGRTIIRSHPVGGVPRRIAFTRTGSRAVIANESGWVDFIR
jgi:DNA-binding beta-propeller fold protein YncE